MEGGGGFHVLDPSVVLESSGLCFAQGYRAR